ncbi:MAG: transcriptional repressor NrdR [Firmicutes bacterium]|nr:transcriptional repressor NrdR [Bacillota bacterium]
MRCPYCNHDQSKVLDSRATDEGASIRRRRECGACGRRFTTYERWEEIPLMVIKKDGRREPFQRQKILTGLLKACEKRPIPVASLEQLVDDIERELRKKGETEVTTRQIGERVMEGLRAIDEVAYVRFASVYREFRDLTALLGEVERLIRKEEAGA